MIQVRDVTHRWGERRVLDDVSCTLGESRIGIIGGNGSGKSSFVRLINGLLLPDTGTVSVDELDVRRHLSAVRQRVGFVFQNPDVQIIFPTVEEDIRFGLQNLGVPAAEQEIRLQAVLQQFELAELRDASCHALSGGQKQLLALAAVLVMRPAVLILDEPTTLLDLANTCRFRRYLAELDLQILLVTHDFDDLDGFDRVLVIDAGRIVVDSTPADAIDTYRAMVRAQA